MNIEYRDASYFRGAYGRGKVRQVEAVLGAIRRTAGNKTDAKAELMAAVEEQAAHAFDRRYLVGTDHDGQPVCFALRWCDGWTYDIAKGGEISESVGARFSSCSFSEETERDAFARMLRHFRDYTGATKRDRIAAELEAAGWPSVADDVRDGLPLETVAERVREIIPPSEAEEPLAILTAEA